MKPLSREELQRLDVLYRLLDESYAGLRRYASLSGAAIRTGNLMAVRVADANLITLSNNVSPIWAEINSIVNPPAEPDAAAALIPAKEILQ